jgi:hypothetical protein
MFGDACKGNILLFFRLQDNDAVAFDSAGAGYAGSLSAEKLAG